ncbi:MAG: hypothetical protein J6M53_08065 [Bacteroidaceae bacterium]|nr:hypothetical protein [Bacteroidaceae bacterium]
MSDPISPRKRTGIVIGLSALLLAIIIPAKRASFARFGSDTSADSIAAALDSIDTTYVEPSIPDSAYLGDDRPVDRAGYEDGYTSGHTDAAMRQGRGTYDEQNPYPTGERDAYVRGYREGYNAGQNYGREHPTADPKHDRRTIEDLVRESDERLR